MHSANVCDEFYVSSEGSALMMLENLDFRLVLELVAHIIVLSAVYFDERIFNQTYIYCSYCWIYIILQVAL